MVSTAPGLERAVSRRWGPRPPPLMPSQWSPATAPPPLCINAVALCGQDLADVGVSHATFNRRIAGWRRWTEDNPVCRCPVDRTPGLVFATNAAYPPPPPLKDWDPFSSGRSANQKVSLASLTTQHQWGGGGECHTGGGGGAPPPLEPCQTHLRHWAAFPCRGLLSGRLILYRTGVGGSEYGWVGLSGFPPILGKVQPPPPKGGGGVSFFGWVGGLLSCCFNGISVCICLLFAGFVCA